jgi:hypothetical protein
MSTLSPQPLYDRLQSTLAPEYILTVYASDDRVHFDAYPPITNIFPTTLNLPCAHFAVHVVGPRVQAAIESA